MKVARIMIIAALAIGSTALAQAQQSKAAFRNADADFKARVEARQANAGDRKTLEELRRMHPVSEKAWVESQIAAAELTRKDLFLYATLENCITNGVESGSNSLNCPGIDVMIALNTLHSNKSTSTTFGTASQQVVVELNDSIFDKMKLHCTDHRATIIAEMTNATPTEASVCSLTLLNN